MKKVASVLLCALAAIAITVILYLTIFGTGVWGVIHFVTLFAVVLAEIVTAGYACLVDGSPRKVAAVILSAFMIPYSAILSVVYITGFPYGYGTYLGWYFAGTVAVNAICLILLLFDSGKKRENDRLQDAKENMLELRKLVKCIMADPASEPVAEQLRALEEKLHFSNDSVITADDEKIRLLLLQLQENIADPEFDREQLLQKIEKAVTTRSIMTSRNV